MAQLEKQDKRPVVDALRDLRNWVAVFEDEYDLDQEVMNTLYEHIDRVGHELENI